MINVVLKTKKIQKEIKIDFKNIIRLLLMFYFLTTLITPCMRSKLFCNEHVSSSIFHIALVTESCSPQLRVTTNIA